MLASIHPLGERARHNRWGLTVTAHLLGSWAGGVAVFGAAALLGTALRVPSQVAVPGMAVAVGLEVWALRPGRRLPGPRRQVNEDWLGRYRGWVYGAGFGVQLGAGVVTIVTSAALYAALLLTVLAQSWQAGVVVGTVYGLGRAAPLVAAARVRHPEQLAAFHRRTQRMAQPVRLTGVAALAALAALAVLAVGVVA
jgi:hypothetical protein